MSEQEKEVINSSEVEMENPDLKEAVDVETPVKQFLVNYSGQKHAPEDDQVTVEMIVNTVAEEFPEFLMAVAEENWIRGYHQALTDVEEGERLAKNEEKDS